MVRKKRNFLNEIMNTEEYAQLRGISQQSVRKSCAMGWNLPGVIEVLPKVGKYWLLKVSVNQIEKKNKK